MDMYSDPNWGQVPPQPQQANPYTMPIMNPNREQHLYPDGHFNTKTVIPHRMPHPTGMPWNMQGLPWGNPSPQPPIVQFTAQNEELQRRNALNTFLHSKRKSDLDAAIPSKQFITEEKMAAHMSGMHISSDYTTHCGEGEGSAGVEQERLGGGGLGHPDINERLKAAKKIIVCEEMRKLHNEPLLPPSILQRLEKPSRALVLWKPPERVNSNDEDEQSNNNNGSNNNNNNNDGAPRFTNERHSVLVPDLATMDVEM